MSDVERAMKNAREANRSVEAEMIRELGDCFDEQTKATDAKVEELNSKLRDIAKAGPEGINELRAEIKAGFDTLEDKVKAVQKVATIPGIYQGDLASKVIAAIDDEDRKAFQVMEYSTTPNQGQDMGRFSNPAFKAGAALWFFYSTMAQNKRQATNANKWMEKRDKLGRALNNVEKAMDWSSDVANAGGDTVPAPVAAEILRLIEDNTIVRPRARKIPMTSLTLDVPQKGTGAIATQIISTQGTTITDSFTAPAVTKLTLTAALFAGRAIASIESVADSAVGLLDYIRTILAEEIGKDEDTQALEGSGSPFTGLSDHASVNEIAAAGANGDAVTYAKLVAILFGARERASRRSGVWYMSDKILSKVVGLRADAVSASDGAGMPIFMWANVQNRPYPTILGYPVEETTVISTTRTKGMSSTLSNAYFGDPMGILFGDRAGINWDVTDTGPSWADYQLDMRLVKRTAIGVGVPTAFTRGIDLETA